jgi:hypothetical protein
MLFQNTFVPAVYFLLASQRLVHALPQDNGLNSDTNTLASVPCDDISKYTVQVSSIFYVLNSLLSAFTFANLLFECSGLEVIIANALPWPAASSTHAGSA